VTVAWQLVVPFAVAGRTPVVAVIPALVALVDAHVPETCENAVMLADAELDDAHVSGDILEAAVTLALVALVPLLVAGVTAVSVVRFQLVSFETSTEC
jgi:hypothetical protein